METESVILSIALLLIERHGADAGDVAAERARVLEGCGDRRTARTWDVISRRIDRIAPPKPASDSDRMAALFDLELSPSTGPMPDAGNDEAREDAELAMSN